MSFILFAVNVTCPPPIGSDTSNVGFCGLSLSMFVTVTDSDGISLFPNVAYATTCVSLFSTVIPSVYGCASVPFSLYVFVTLLIGYVTVRTFLLLVLCC